LLWFGALIALIAVGRIPVLHAWSDWINTHRSRLVTVPLTVTGAGLIIMIWGWTVVGIRNGRAMTSSEAQQFAGQPLPLPGMQSFGRGRFKGVARGRQTDQPVEWSFKEMKDAWHAGTWWRDSDMRRNFLITAGGIAVFLGGFLLFLVLLKPSSAKLLMAGSGIYGVTRLIDGFWRA
jgi:hypothetical protein